MPILVHANANEQIILVQYCKPLLGQWNLNIGLILCQDYNVVWDLFVKPQLTKESQLRNEI